MQVGEKALLPAVRAAPDDMLIIANGFSCHEQIKQGAGRKSLHLAEVLHMALGEKVHSSHDHGPSMWRDHRPHPPKQEPLAQEKRKKMAVKTAGLIGIGLLAGGLLAWSLARSRS
jgi:hypothetical protein